MGFDLGSIEDYVSSHLRLFIVSVAGLLFLLGIIAVSVFFIAVRGAEQTMVPDVRGKELTEALLELQVKELFPRLQLRYSQTPRDKGLILEQEPNPGTIVKAGRRIRLVVSQGVVMNRVENFIGRNVDDVRIDLLTIYTSSGGVPILTMSEPLIYEFSSQMPGVILAQKPEPGAEISGPMNIEFVVSRGRENIRVNVPNLVGLDISEALELTGSSGINFQFNIRDAREGERGETVVAQVPAANSFISINNVVNITVTRPDRLAESEVSGLFSYTIPQNPYPLAVRLDTIRPTGERINLLAANYGGGEFTAPYKLPAGSVLVLTMMNRELYRETVH